MAGAHWDYIIVGSGFGGSVSAMRLVDKGYRVLLLEKGRRLQAKDFPKTNWNLKRWMWLPFVGFRGLFKMTFLRHVTALSGVGVGGGSLVYANTLPTPKGDFFRNGPWAELADWESELKSHYETAATMLGAAKNPHHTYPDEVIKKIGAQIGREDKFEHTRVAVYFGKPGETVPDPYFDGEGPDRTGCTLCGACMTGCRHGAKNTLDKNYLYLAEKRGLTLEADSEVTWVRPTAEGRYEVSVRQGTGLFKRKRSFRADKVIFAGGVLGTVDLLLRLRDSDKGLPELSPKVGHYVRTNSEVLMGIVTRDKKRDLSRGVAIGSILHTDEHSHLEPVRYGSGSGFFRLMATPHSAGSNAFSRLFGAFKYALRHPIQTVRAWLVWNWARRTIILLYMRTLEGHINLRRGRRPRTLFRRRMISELGDGPAPSASIPEATELAMKIAKEADGYPQSMLTETLLGVPTTAHILGGCPMGETREQGVIDSSHRVHGYEGLYVIDGSAISANPGVNPSLTICALAERAMSKIPDKTAAE